MIAGLLIGKHKSMGCPGKNVRLLLGRPMAEYGYLALKHSLLVERIFVSTDSPQIAEVGGKYDAELIERPPELAQPNSTVEDTLSHAFHEMGRRLSSEIEMVVLVFANSPTIPVGALDRGIELLRQHPDADSVTSVCEYNMFSPARARKIDANGIIRPFVALSLIPNLSSIRDEQGKCYFEDFTIQVLRRRCLSDIEHGEPPFKWMGKRTMAIVNEYGFDIDYEWQIPVIEDWLLKHGFTETTTPYETSDERLTTAKGR